MPRHATNETGDRSAVLSAIRARERSIRQAIRGARRRVWSAVVDIAVAAVVTAVFWWIAGPRVQSAVLGALLGRDPFDAVIVAAVAAAGGLMWWVAIARLVRAISVMRRAETWVRGVPYPCPACGYEVGQPDGICAECGWRANG